MQPPEISPETPSAPLKRKRCENCFALFLPKRKWARFCSNQCRKEFHWHGSAFGPVKIRVEKLVEARYRELREMFQAHATEMERRVKRLESR